MADWLVSDQQPSLRADYTLCRVASDLKIGETLDLPNWLASLTFGRGIAA